MSPVITNKQINNSYEKDEIALLFKNFTTDTLHLILQTECPLLKKTNTQ